MRKRNVARLRARGVEEKILLSSAKIAVVIVIQTESGHPFYHIEGRFRLQRWRWFSISFSVSSI